MTTKRPHLPDDDDRGFAFDRAGVVRRQGIADAMVGHSLSRVRYILLEYAEGAVGDHTGLRSVTDPAELHEPAWKFEGFHNVDFGIEFELDDGAAFFATWDMPWPDSLRLARGDMSTWTGASWDVTDVPPWNLFTKTPLASFELHYEPWDSEGGFWCRDMTLIAGSTVITIDGADADGDGRMMPSATNLAVTFLTLDSKT